jgi:hypothetical protein
MNNSHLTAAKRIGASVPLKVLLKKSLILRIQSILDFGCGRCADVEWLLNNGYNAKGFDPYWSPLKKPLQYKYDIILCTYVLNIVDNDTRLAIIKQLKRMTKTSGKIYITVRRDFKKDHTTVDGVHQYLVKLPFPIVKENTQYCIYKLCNRR